MIFSQDQDLVEAVNDAKDQADSDKNILKFYSAYPNSETSKNLYGIKGTRAIKISKQDYDACIDPADYRPKQKAYPGLR